MIVAGKVFENSALSGLKRFDTTEKLFAVACANPGLTGIGKPICQKDGKRWRNSLVKGG